MYKLRNIFLIFACLSVLTACGGGGAASTSSDGFKSESKSQVVGPAGGSITHTLASGAVFTFDVPPGALPVATTLSLSTQQPTAGQRFNLVLQPSGLLLANGAKGTLTITLPPGQTLPATGGVVYDGVLIPYTTLSDGSLQVSLSKFADTTVAKPSFNLFNALLFKDVSSPILSNVCGTAPSLQTNGGLTVEDALAIELYGGCMVTTVQELANTGQYSEAVRVSESVAAYLQRTGSSSADSFITQANSIACTAYEGALTYARNTTVTTTGILNPVIRPILYWESIIQKLGATCARIAPTEYQGVVHDKISQSVDYYTRQKPNITSTSSSNYTAAKSEATANSRTKNEVLSLTPPAGVSNIVTTEITQRAQPVLLDALLQAPWNSCNSINADYTELMNLMVTLESPDSVKDAAQYCGTLLQAQTKNLAGTVIDTLTPNLGGISASQKRVSGSIKAAKNATLVLDGPIQAMKCPAGSASGETLTIKLDGTTLRSGLTAPYLSNPLEIDIKTALETAHPNATANLTQAVLALERTGSTCGDFWGTNPVPLVSLTLTFTERKIVFSVGTNGVPPLPGSEIHSINPDGSGDTRLTSNPVVTFPEIPGEAPAYLDHEHSDGSPSMSPDGTKIAFIRDSQNLMVMNADGSGITALTGQAMGVSAAASAAWSPDGTKIASSDGVYTINAAGGTATLIYSFANRYVSGPAWSPDGTKLLFSGFTDNNSSNYGLYVMNADGTGSATQLIADPGYSIETSSSAWSSDGSKIVFSGVLNCAGNNCSVGIWVINANGSNPQLEYAFPSGTGEGYGSLPSWSPDGAKIAFTDRHDIYLMNADGSNLTNITNYDATKSAAGTAWR